MEGDGLQLSRPPLFKGQNYVFWKMRMIGFIQYNGMQLINIIKNGIPTLIDKSGELFPFESMTKKEKCFCQNNAKARHIIMRALSEEEISKVHVMVSAKEMWDTLALTYEDSKEVEEKEEKKEEVLQRKEESYVNLGGFGLIQF